MKNLETALENGFKVSRKGTKHKKDFVLNTIERPLTLSCAIYFLNKHTDLTLNDFSYLNRKVNTYAKDFHTNTKSDAKIVVYNKSVKLVFGKGVDKEEVSLNYDTFIDIFKFLNDELLFTTDFNNYPR
jgi:hypothetical protein